MPFCLCLKLSWLAARCTLPKTIVQRLQASVALACNKWSCVRLALHILLLAEGNSEDHDTCTRAAPAKACLSCVLQIAGTKEKEERVGNCLWCTHLSFKFHLSSSSHLEQTLMNNYISKESKQYMNMLRQKCVQWACGSMTCSSSARSNRSTDHI